MFSDNKALAGIFIFIIVVALTLAAIGIGITILAIAELLFNIEVGVCT